MPVSVDSPHSVRASHCSLLLTRTQCESLDHPREQLKYTELFAQKIRKCRTCKSSFFHDQQSTKLGGIFKAIKTFNSILSFIHGRSINRYDHMEAVDIEWGGWRWTKSNLGLFSDLNVSWQPCHQQKKTKLYFVFFFAEFKSFLSS